MDGVEDLEDDGGGADDMVDVAVDVAVDGGKGVAVGMDVGTATSREGMRWWISSRWRPHRARAVEKALYLYSNSF